MAAFPLNIPLRRNEDYIATWTFADNTGAPMNISGWTLELDIKGRLDELTVLASGTFDIYDPVNGKAELFINGADLAGYGNSLHTYNLPYDMRATDGDGVRKDLVAGFIVLERGITT